MNSTALTSASRDIGLELSRTALYPPLSHDGLELVQFSTTVSEAVAFDYKVNGASGPLPGLTLFQGHNSGHLGINREFIAQYPGAWPVPVEIQAFQNDVLMDSATVLLHDTRAMVAHRCEVTVYPNPVNIVPEVESGSTVSAVFFDENDLQLPHLEMNWEVVLPQAPPGVGVDGRSIVVSPEAQPGGVTVRVREHSGLEQATTLLLQHTEGIDLTLNRDYFYPPLLNPRTVLLPISTNRPDNTGLTFQLTINGAPFSKGVGIYKMDNSGEVGVFFDNGFINSFPGPWPAQLRLLAYLDKSLVDSTAMSLHDTRTIEFHSIDLEFLPTDTVTIPDSGNVAVAAMARLYDANGLLVPHEEVVWATSLVEPVEGVELFAHIVQVNPPARPGKVRVAVRVQGGLNRAKVLTLV
ncbi:hypothetical protein ACX3YG_10995 [Pseudomonas wadenswilerensis]